TSGQLKPSSAYIFRAPFLLEEDKRNMNVRPKRTYSGMRYNAGYSDHLPIVLEFCE
ncbi:MAG: endonuclease, partial [Paludibacteraceae bacterium]|nr:endonuclease [Paludibacteraceae bacterium]